MLKVISALLILISSSSAHLVRINSDSLVKDIDQNLFFDDTESHEKMSPKEAEEYCEKLDIAGHKNWRLPTFNELFLLSQNDIKIFKTINSGWFISTDEEKSTEKPIWLIEPFSRRVVFIESNSDEYKFNFKCVTKVEKCIKSASISE